MPKNIVAPPAAVVAVDRLTLQADDARGSVLPLGSCGSMDGWAGHVCFSEE
jgi:hypothetical protein